MNRKRIAAVAAVVCLILTMGIISFGAEGQWKLKNGNWFYQLSNGTLVSNTWFQDKDSSWYHFDKNGVMQTGWFQEGGKWYYLLPSGKMKTGWHEDRGNWYYLNTNGTMFTGWLKLKDVWYYLNTAGGAMKTGWHEDKGNWYFFEDSGAMAVNVTKSINGVSYTFGQDGVWNNSSGSTAVANQTTFGMGAWSGNTFYNGWPNLKVTAPAGSTIYTSEQIRTAVGSDSKTLVNDGTVTVEKVNESADNLIYDSMFRLPDGNSVFQLAYINVYSPTIAVTAEQYSIQLREQLTGQRNLPHTIEGTERVSLAGSEYIKLKTTMLGRTTNQDIYIKKLDHFIVMLTVTYLPENSGSVSSVINGITNSR